MRRVETQLDEDTERKKLRQLAPSEQIEYLLLKTQTLEAIANKYGMLIQIFEKKMKEFVVEATEAIHRNENH